jgi:hypothetical protein
VVELAGRAFSAMPPAAIEEAQAQGLPLVGLRDEIPFVEASAQVHEMLVELRVQDLLTEESAGQAFMNLLLADEDYLGLTAELARRTGHPVVLEDVTHQMLAYSGRTPESDLSPPSGRFTHGRCTSVTYRRGIRRTWSPPRAPDPSAQSSRAPGALSSCAVSRGDGCTCCTGQRHRRRAT